MITYSCADDWREEPLDEESRVTDERCAKDAQAIKQNSRSTRRSRCIALKNRGTLTLHSCIPPFHHSLTFTGIAKRVQCIQRSDAESHGRVCLSFSNLPLLLLEIADRFHTIVIKTRVQIDTNTFSSFDFPSALQQHTFAMCIIIKGNGMRLCVCVFKTAQLVISTKA